MKNIFRKKIKLKKQSLPLFVVLVVASIALALSSIVIPKIMAGDTVVSDIALQAENKEKIISLTVTDTNPEDTKLVIPLPEGVTYQSNSTPNIGVTQDTVNHQLVIDWVEGQDKQIILQFEVKEEGIYDFIAQTVREDNPVTSATCSVTIQSTLPSSSEDINSNSTGDNNVVPPETTTEDTTNNEIADPTQETSTSEGEAIDSDTEENVNDISSTEKQAILSDNTNYNFNYNLSPENNEATEFSLQDVVLDENSEGYGSISFILPEGMSSNVNDILPSGWDIIHILSGFSIIIDPGASATEIKNFLSLLRLTANSEYKAPSTVSITIEQNEISHWVDPSGKSHYYQFVPNIMHFQQAYNSAKSMTYKGLTGYLATITSPEEQAFIFQSIAKNPGWLGGASLVFSNGNKIHDEQVISEKTFSDNKNVDYKQGEQWYWIDGPEAGTVFYNTKTYDKENGPVDNIYNNFNSLTKEPSNNNKIENVLQFALNNTGYWNDLADNRVDPKYVKGYYVEFSEYGDQKEEDSENTVTVPIPQAVTAHFLDIYNKKISEDSHSSGPVGKPYKTEQKDIPGYKLKKVEGKPEGTFTDKPQTVTYVYTEDVLRFYDVPSELSFNETKISSKTETISRKEPNWKIIVEDNRLNRPNWRVTAQLEEQFKDSSGNSVKGNILLFRKANQSDQWIVPDGAVNVFDGTSNDKDDLYDVSWKPDEGPMLQVAPGTVKVGKYTGVINWQLVDAPV